MSIIDQARQLAESKLAGVLPRRWAHVQAVGTKAERVQAAADPDDAAALVAAAWLHDVGYAPDLVDTGFHPLDGGRWLRTTGFDERVTALVAHHSCASTEAELRGLHDELVTEFPREESATADLLWFCDLTTGPDGQDFDVVDRLTEIRSRYGAGHLVTQFIDLAEADMLAAVHRAKARIHTAGIDIQPM